MNRIAVIAAATLLLAGCTAATPEDTETPDARPEPVTVFLAASLTDPFTQLEGSSRTPTPAPTSS